jgi:hypothetical protein
LRVALDEYFYYLFLPKMLVAVLERNSRDCASAVLTANANTRLRAKSDSDRLVFFIMFVL